MLPIGPRSGWRRQPRPGPEQATPTMASLSVRVDFAPDRRLGPGKIVLLEKIAVHGSISAAGREMDMSYRRAWELVEELNRLFRGPLVSARTGGRQGGGTTLTPLGQKVVAAYRQTERAVEEAAHPYVAEMSAARATTALSPRSSKR